MGEPDAQTRLRMEQEYGFNHQEMMDIPDAADADRVASQLIHKIGHADRDEDLDS
jgi:hypothetical protein